MMSKTPRWPKTLVDSNTYRPAQKTGGKEQAATAVPVLSGGKQAGSTLSKTSVRYGRVNSLDGRGSDSTASGCKVGGSLKRGSLSQPGNAGHQATRQASRPAGPARRLCSSRSFSSLHTSSLAAAPFMRSSRSLSRLDQRSAEDDSDAVSSSQVKKGQTTEKKAFSSGQPFSSGEQIRDNKDQCHGNNAEKMKRSSSSEPADSSSSLVCTSECHPRCHKVKKQTRDGVYTLCAMTSGMRRNLVQAVLKNVRPSVTPEITRGTEEMTHLKSQKKDLHSAEGLEKDEHLYRFLQERKSSDCAEETHEQQPEGEQSSADGSSTSPMSAAPQPFSPISPSSVLSSISPLQQVNGGAPCQCLLVVADTQSSVTEASSCAEGAKSGSFISTTTRSNDGECFDEESAMQRETMEQVKTTTQSEDQKVPFKMGCDCKKVEQRPCEQQTEHLVKENDLSNLPAEQALALQQLQKMNYDLRCELEAQKRSQEEARETELRRRVELLAQQAQLLVTGDATALAQAHLEQDRRLFLELQVEWERCVASLKSQLSFSEEQRKEAELRLTQLQQELQSFHSVREEADRLQNQLQEVTTQLHANEEAQAQKEALLQKHLMLLEESQDRERKSLSASLAKADQHSQDLQEKLVRAEQQVEKLDKTQTWAKELEKAQQQLQEELAFTVSAVQKLQQEREQLERHCQELQNQLSEAEGEVSRLKTDETLYYNLEHSYESVCVELQLALGKVQQKESETQDMQEGYERLLDKKEQELSEVLLKMEVLGNSLEETEVKLNELLKVCTCASSQLKDDSSNPAQQNERLNDSRPRAVDSGQVFNSCNAGEHARTHSHSIDSSYPEAVTAGDDSEKFMSAIQILETKLFVTEEKLRDIMQRLDEYQRHATCQDPRLCSQLTESRATTQHLSLLLHSQAKQSQRFAQETENCCRMLVGRFQVALNIIQACRERLQAGPIDIPDLEKQLATVVGCLQKGEKDAEKQKQASRNASKGENKILNDDTLAAAESNVSSKSKLTNTLHQEDNTESIEKCLMNELFVVEHIVSVLQSEHGIRQLCLGPREDEGGVAHRYKSIITQRIALMTEKRSAECDNSVQLNMAISRVCAEVELIYAASKLLQEYESTAQGNNQDVEHQRKGLADINPPELAPYEEQVQVEDSGLKGAATAVEMDDSDVKQVEADKEPGWLERLLTRLQRRAKCLRQLIQEISDVSGAQCGMDEVWENASAADLNWVLQEAKLIYLSDRLRLDLEQEMQQSEVFQDKLQGLCKERDITLKDEQETFNHTLCQLQEDNSVLREELERAKQKIISVETGNQTLLEDIEKIKDFHEKRMKKLEAEFQEEIRELQQIHEEELKHLHGYYTSKEKRTKTCIEAPAFSRITTSIPDQTVMDGKTKVELRNQVVGGDAMREAYQADGEKHKASSQDDEAFSAMEDMHRKLIADLQQQHEKEVAALLKEKDQQLQEETAATVTAIVAMRRAHKLELEKSRRFQHIKESADMAQLHAEHEKEIQLMHEELEVLSDQHTQKCLENSRLNQELQDERRTLIQCQKENQELKKKQRETNPMSEAPFLPNGKQPHVAPQMNDFYEMEVILRAREAEMQFLRQEARSLKEDLKIARMDKIYAQNKLKALYRKSQDEPCRDVSNLCEDFEFAPWSATREDTVANSSNAAFINKTEKSPLARQIRGVSLKSLKEGLSVQERMKLFESF